MKLCLFCGKNPPDTSINEDPDATLCRECWLK